MADPSATPEVGRDDGGGHPAGRGRARLLAVVATVLVLAFLDWAQVALMPLAFAVFLVILLWPLQVRLERRLPRKLAYLISVLVLLAVLAGFASALVWSGQKVVEGAPRYAERLQEMASAARDWAASRGLPLPADEVSADATQGLARRALVAVSSSLSAIVLILAFTILALLEGHSFRAKAQSAFRHQRHARSVAEAAGRIVVRFQQYLWARTVVAIVQGVSAWLVALVLGLDLALLWGLIAFLLNYIPSLGSILAVIPPSLFALVQFGGWQRPLLVLVAMSLLQIVLGNFVDPKIEGRFLALSPVVVLFSIVFWGWMWGVAGALLGVPIMVALVIVLDDHPPTRWIAALLAREPRRPGEGVPEAAAD